METWRDVIGYEGLYIVNNMGEVRCLPKIVGFSAGYIQKARTMKQRLIKGYPSINVCKNGIKKVLKIHRIVSMAFIPNHENKNQINHINGDKTDNRVENLEWCTGSENSLHKFRVLKVAHPKWGRGRSGKKNGRAKPVIQLSMSGEFIKEWDSANLANKSFGENKGSIYACCRGNTTKAYGFKWKYA